MNAQSICRKLLEADVDDIDTSSEIQRYSETGDFDEGAYDIVREARELYQRLIKDNTISTLLKERPYDNSSVAQAVIRIALERRRSKGAQNAYRRLKRLNYLL